MSAAASATAAARACSTASTSRSAPDRTESLRHPPGDCATLADRDRKPGPCGARCRAARGGRVRCRGARGTGPDGGRDARRAVPTLRPEVLAELPHDPAAFTQGFEIDGGVLYEGTGLEGRSQLRELDPDDGRGPPGGPAARAAVRRGHHGRRRPDLAADLARRRRARVGPGDADAAPRGPARRRGLGAVRRRRRPAGPQRRHGPPALPRPRHVRRAGFGRRDARRGAGDRAQRAGVRRRAGVGERLADRPHRAHRPGRPGRSRRWSTRPGCSTRPAGPAADVLNGIAAVPGGDGEFLVTGKLWPVTFRVRFDG